MLPKDQSFLNVFIITAAGFKCCVVHVKRLPVLHFCAGYIFGPWSHIAHLDLFENRLSLEMGES